MHSVSYLKAFRQAVVDNYADMALAILRQIKYPLDLLADVLQRDRRASKSSNPTINHVAYLAVMREFRDRSMAQELKPGAYFMKPEGKWDRIFFYDFTAYLIITYKNENELLANLIAADSPQFLGDVVNLSEDVVMRYLEWKYSRVINDNSQDDYVYLTEAIGRLSDTERQKLWQFLEREMLTETTDREWFRRDVADAKAKWTNTQVKEYDLNTLLFDTRQVISNAESVGIDTEEDANRLAKEVNNLGEGKEIGIIAMAKYLSDVILGRYRHLLTK